MRTSFVEQLRAASESAAKKADPWHNNLTRLKGRIGSDGIERISTQAVFDVLGLPMARRQGATHRLAKIMRELGWSPLRIRDLGPAGFRDQVRGYARVRL